MEKRDGEANMQKIGIDICQATETFEVMSKIDISYFLLYFCKFKLSLLKIVSNLSIYKLAKNKYFGAKKFSANLPYDK